MIFQKFYGVVTTARPQQKNLLHHNSFSAMTKLATSKIQCDQYFFLESLPNYRKT